MKALKDLLKQLAAGAEDEDQAIKTLLNIKEQDIASYKEEIDKIRQQNFDLEEGNYPQRLADFRKQLEKANLDGFVLKTSDKYLNEYVSLDYYQLQYLTGFTGSLALCVVTKNKAVMFVDGRYTLQAKQELLQDFFEIQPYSLKDIKNWVVNNTESTDKIAIDSSVHSILEVNLFKEIFAQRLQVLNHNLVDSIWQNKAEEPISEVRVHSLELAHESIDDKKEKLLQEFANDYDYFLLTECDCISYLLNIRAKDVSFNPIVLSYLLLDNKGNYHLFIDSNKLTKDVKDYFAKNKINVHENKDVIKNIESLTKGKKLAICKSSPYIFLNSLQEKTQVSLVENFCTAIKSKKSEKVIESMKKSHIKDGLAVSKLLMEVENKITNDEKISEYEIANLCEYFRKEQEDYYSMSFNPIVGIDGNGAIVHYRPEEKTSKLTHKNCHILIDSGAHYLDGTTDITRSMSFADDESYNKHYTLVLKGLLALSNLKFPKGTTGDYIDIIARQFLFQHGVQYLHGTGHGVGYFLNVHEGPQRIAPLKNDIILEEGMVLSNEPGAYFTDKYGIRLENLIVVKQSKYKDFLEFEEITYTPFNTKNIVVFLLSEQERKQLNDYHKKVYELLKDKTEDSKLLAFLQEKTKAI